MTSTISLMNTALTGKTVRKSNIELLRLVAMFLIVATHTNFFALGRPKITAFDAEPIWITLRFTSQSFTYIGVILFILISGYFGIKPKFCSVVAFLFQVLFFSLFCLGIVYLAGLIIGTPLIAWKHFGESFMVLTHFNWFIPSYLLLMLFAPTINTFCEVSSKLKVGCFIILLFAASTYLGWSTHYCKEFNDGYSFVSLLLLYVMGRYLRLYPNYFVNRKLSTDAIHFIIYVVVNTIIALLRIKNPYRMSLFALNNPLQLYGSICFFLFFTKLQFQNNTINTLAKGTFGIFLLQMHPQVVPHFRALIKYLHAQLNHYIYFVAIVGVIVAFCAAGILLDRIRQWCWNKVDKPIDRAYHHVKERLVQALNS